MDTNVYPFESGSVARSYPDLSLPGLVTALTKQRSTEKIYENYAYLHLTKRK